jgi:hypothetical protein
MTNGHDDELRHAQAAALEQETRALNCERALEHAQDEVATLRAQLAELDGDLRRTKLDAYHAAQHTGCVPLADLRALLTKYDNVTNSPYVLAALRVFVAQAEQRAAAANDDAS